ncbi:MAG: hypothetical protein WAO02_15560 [Verrucomicrobiia bacterium]
MAGSPRQFFNPCSSHKNERIPAKIWELLRRNSSFRRNVNRLRALDKRGAKETEEYQEVARQFNLATDALAEALRQKNSPTLKEKIATLKAQQAAAWQSLEPIKNRPIRRQTFRLIEKHRKTHPLAALALTWLVPEPEFFICCKRCGRIQEGHGISPDLRDSSWVWRNAYVGRGRKLAVKVGGESRTRGPGIFAPRLTNPFPDWQNWRPGGALFDCTTSWNRLPKSFRSWFVSEWQNHYDSKDGYEFNYVRPPRRNDILSRDTAAQYWGFLETVSRARLFAISPTLLTTKDVGAVFERLQNRVKKGLPEGREHLFGSEAAWGHYLALKERRLSLAEHIVGADYQKEDSTIVTEKVRNQRRNVQFGVKAVEKMTALVYPVFELKNAALTHSAPPRDKKKRRKPQATAPVSKQPAGG